MLPAGWNLDQENYILRYLHTDKDWMIMNFAFEEDTGIGTLTITRGDMQIEGREFDANIFLPNFVPGPQATRKIQLLMPKVDNLMYKFHTLMKPIRDAKPGATATAAAVVNPSPAPPPDPAPKPQPEPPIPTPSYPDILIDPHSPFRNIGQRDLDPFGGRRERYDPFNALPYPGGPDGGGMLGTIPPPFGRDNR